MMSSVKNVASKLLKLYVYPECPYCHKATIAAHERGIPIETVNVPRDTPEWYKKINPSETVPTLELKEGEYLYESNLIVQYFDNIASPACVLMGKTPYQRHRIEFFLSQVGDLSAASNELLWEPRSAAKHKDLDDNVAYIDNIVAETQKTGGPFLFDDDFTMADIAVVPFLIRFSVALSYYTGHDLFAKGPHLKKLWAAALQRPSVSSTSVPLNQYLKGYASHVPADAQIQGAKTGPVLYGNQFCPFVDRARLACAAKGFKPYYIEIELPNQPAWYKFVNPRQTVPTLVTENGEHVHESQLVANYVDQAVATGPQLVPRGDAAKEYALNYFLVHVNYFVAAFHALRSDPKSAKAKEELVWCITELQKLLAKKPFGEGSFFGGASWNAGDIAWMPFVLRLKVATPDQLGGADFFAEYPFLDAYLTAGLATDFTKGILKTPEEYRAHAASLKK